MVFVTSNYLLSKTISAFVSFASSFLYVLLSSLKFINDNS